MYCDGLEVWMLLSAALCWGFRTSVLKQRQQHFSSLAHFQPELRVAAKSAVVTATACRVTFDPATSNLVAVG